jgi:hypothetical protein
VRNSVPRNEYHALQAMLTGQNHTQIVISITPPLLSNSIKYIIAFKHEARRGGWQQVTWFLFVKNR